MRTFRSDVLLEYAFHGLLIENLISGLSSKILRRKLLKWGLKKSHFSIFEFSEVFVRFDRVILNK